MILADLRYVKYGCLIASLLVLAGCEGLQSAFAPAGVNAREVVWLWWGMLAGGTLVFLLVLGLLLYSLFSQHSRRRHISARQFIIFGGIVLPLVTLSVLLAASLGAGSSLFASDDNTETLTIRVTGHQWWWEVQYLDKEGKPLFTTANEIYIPVGKQVEFVLTSADVIHSFWVPSLAGKLDLLPGHNNRLLVEADEAGIYRGQCAEFCGRAHALMAFYVVVTSAEKFTDWLERQQSPAKQPVTDLQQQGARRFKESGCMLCHSVRGQGAHGETAPDLTHVGSRLSIGAGLIKNNQDNLRRWIAHNDQLKPGNKMPEYDHLNSQTLKAISTYLKGLE